MAFYIFDHIQWIEQYYTFYVNYNDLMYDRECDVREFMTRIFSVWQSISIYVPIEFIFTILGIYTLSIATKIIFSINQ